MGTDDQVINAVVVDVIDGVFTGCNGRSPPQLARPPQLSLIDAPSCQSNPEVPLKLSNNLRNQASRVKPPGSLLHAVNLSMHHFLQALLDALAGAGVDPV